MVPMNHSNKHRTSLAESEEGRLRIEENPLPFDTYPTPSGTEPVPRVGECADKRTLGCHCIRDKNGCANERPSGSVGGTGKLVSLLRSQPLRQGYLPHSGQRQKSFARTVFRNLGSQPHFAQVNMVFE